MIYPEDFETRLGFDQIRQGISNYCLGVPGRKMVGGLVFLSELSPIQPLLLQGLEARQILDRGEDLPLLVYDDPEVWFQTASVEGNFLEGEDFLKIGKALEIIQALKNFLQKNQSTCPNLFQLIPGGYL